MPLVAAEFAKMCVEQGLNYGTQPHYMLAVAQLRSGISDGVQGGQIGPFRLSQAEWDTNRTNAEYNFDFLPNDINDPEMQCAVFSLWARLTLDAFALKNNRNPSAQELYLAQWPGAAPASLTADLQAALDATGPLIDPATAQVPGASPTMSTKLTEVERPAPSVVLSPKLSRLRDANAQRLQNMRITAHIPNVDGVATRLVAQAAKEQYQAISNTTLVPWFVIAVIHEREASQKFSCSIAQGDPWNRISVNEPADRGPFSSFEQAAVDALVKCPPFAAGWKDWTFAGALTLLEQYNGLGYASRNLPSPYIWGGTDQYVKGKFTSDHHFEPNTVDAQLGCAPLLVRMKAADATIPI